MIRKCMLTAIAAGTLCGISSFAEEQKQSEKFFLNELKLGTFSGRIQSTSMQRDESTHLNDSTGGGNSHSNTLGLLLNYKSPELFETGLSLGAQYINAQVLESGGGKADAGKSAGAKQSWLSNGQEHLLNELYIDWNLKTFGWDKSNLRVGRQVIVNDFMLSYDARHKPQAFEGVVLNLNDFEDFKISLGHVQRFSSWSSQHDSGDAFNYKFKDVEDVILDGFSVGEGSFSTDGIHFVSVNYTGIENVDLTFYDYYADDLINTYGVDSYFALSDNLVLNLKYAKQRAIGELDDVLGYKFESALYEAQFRFKFDKLSITPGWFHVPGYNNGNFMIPFSLDSASDYHLMVYANTLAAGAHNYFLEASYQFSDKTSAWFMYTYTDHTTQTVNYDGQEVNLIVSHKLTDDLKISVKLGYGFRNGKNDTVDTHKTDTRLFLTYCF